MSHSGHLEETLRRILASALTTEVEDPRVGFVTISEVRLNRDRSVAQVFYTVMGDEEERARSLAGLKRARGFLRQIIGDHTRLRQIPELRFQYDDSLDRSFRLEKILDEVVPPSCGDEDADGEPESDGPGSAGEADA